MKELQESVAQRCVRLRALSHHVTWFLGTRMPRAIPLVFVVGYPKSGTTWVCQVAADYLQLPFPRFSIFPIGCPAVVHGHERVWKRYPRGLYVMRDGRDVMASLYHFLARRLPEGDRPQLTRAERKLFPGLVNRHDVERNFFPFLEQQLKHPHAARVHWGDHVRSYFTVGNENVVLLRYEDLRTNGEESFAAAMSQLTGQPADRERVAITLDRFSFARQSGRKPGQEDRRSFLRKGQVGDWRNHFSRDAAQLFDDVCGEALITAGYEVDRTWVASVGDRPASSTHEESDTTL